jgi:hypothetical protein
MSTYPQFPKTVETSDLGWFRRTLLRAYDPVLEFNQFSRAISAAARMRERELGGSSAALRFALEGILPWRIRNAQQNVEPERVDSEAFANYLRLLQSTTDKRIAVAPSPDELAEVVFGALDELHGYLLAHELVSELYMAAEEMIAGMYAGDDNDRAPEPAKNEERTSPVPSSANQHDLALAA